jgi:hypothetical protein
MKIFALFKTLFISNKAFKKVQIKKTKKLKEITVKALLCSSFLIFILLFVNLRNKFFKYIQKKSN